VSFEEFPLEEYLRQLEKKYGDRRKVDFERERTTVTKYFETVRARLAGTYTIDKVLAVGGTGIVHRGSHDRFHQPVVVKINRPNIEPEEASMVEHEAQVLPTLTHPNIITVLDLGECVDHTPKLTYIVEPFIEGSKPFFTFDENERKGTWLDEKLEELSREIPSTLKLGFGEDTSKTISLIASLLDRVSELFYQWIDLLVHVHEKGFVYLDVKPENVLIDDHYHLTSIDYGSIERVDPEDASPVQVFYTRRYAHPGLIEVIKDKPSSNRVHGSTQRKKLRPAFDYYALGTSMLEILNEIARIRPHVVPQLPLYRSLHFLATRLLDGVNSNRQQYRYAAQVFPSLRDSDYAHLGYTSLKDARRDIEKERGRWNLEKRVPELAAYSKDIVRLVPGFNTVLTARLRGIIEHPLVGRLKYITQLGLVSLVYPTADHSRYDHALGAYTYTTYYVKSLFNDQGNPLFRNLVGSEDLNAVLLAALLHDLGQYPLAHDLEEVHPGIFKHGPIGIDFLEDSMPDHRGRTLRDIIEDPEHGWNVGIDSLRRLFRARSRSRAQSKSRRSSKNQDLPQQTEKASLKTNVLAAIVDGQVDADKADYIIRDSARCELPYGAQLDLERLLRVLTVAIIPDAEPEQRVSLGVYDKGLVSAHAFGLARYQLLSTVYWHHTSRIIKCMLQYATAMGLPLDVFSPKESEREIKELQIRQQLLKFLKSLVPPFEVPMRQSDYPTSQVNGSLELSEKPPDEVISTVLNGSELKTHSEVHTVNAWYPGISWTDWLMLQWIADLPDACVQSCHLITGIQTRRLYKRIATFARGTRAYEDLIRKLDDLSWPDRVDICRKLHQKVYERLKRDWTDLNTSTLSKSDFEDLCKSHLLVLVDIPSPSRKVGYVEPLGIVPELREKSYNQEIRHAFEDTSWQEVMRSMNDAIAPVRVLCHPDVRNVVSAVYAPVGERAPHMSLEARIAQELNEVLGGR
jgi:HD superfamily phosphohydrolase